MLNPLALSAFLGFWASIYLLHVFLRSNQRTSQWYQERIISWGVSINILHARWYTTRFNRLFSRCAQFEYMPWRLWFSLGIVFGLVAMVLSVALLSLLAYNTLTRKPIEQQVLTPVMPGVNLPLSQLGFYLMTLLVCGIVHEFGHAVAAVRERVRVNGFGLFVLGVYPGAFVDLSTPDLQCLSPVRQLRIYCAGVWHNGIVVLVSLLIMQALPWLLTPLYTVGGGVGVTYLREKSVVTGPRGLFLGDSITRLNTCPVRRLSDWYSCLDQAGINPSGYCLPMTQLKELDASAGMKLMTRLGNVECCANQSSTHLCFTYVSKAVNKVQFACLPARTVTERTPCHLNSDCYQPRTDSVCLLPSLDNSTRLVRIVHSRRPPILFLGDLRDLLFSVGVSDYVPKLPVIPLSLPYVVDTFCKYLISLSGALAILNVVPCYALDGQWILCAFMELLVGRLIQSREVRQTLFSVILFFGTILLMINVVLALWFLFLSSMLDS